MTIFSHSLNSLFCSYGYLTHKYVAILTGIIAWYHSSLCCKLQKNILVLPSICLAVLVEYPRCASVSPHVPLVLLLFVDLFLFHGLYFLLLSDCRLAVWRHHRSSPGPLPVRFPVLVLGYGLNFELYFFRPLPEYEKCNIFTILYNIKQSQMASFENSWDEILPKNKDIYHFMISLITVLQATEKHFSLTFNLSRRACRISSMRICVSTCPPRLAPLRRPLPLPRLTKADYCLDHPISHILCG